MPEVLLQDAFWSAVAALGFAVLFNVPPRALPVCMMCGALGHGTRTLMMSAGFEIELATLLGATAVGYLALVFARRMNIPTPVFAISGAIPLVPGVFAYSTLIGVIDIATADPGTVTPDMLIEMVVNGIKTGLILITIAAGIAAPALLFDRRSVV